MVPPDSARLAERILARLRPAIVEAIEAEVGGDEPSESADTLSADEEARIDEWLARKQQRDKQARRISSVKRTRRPT